MPGDRTDLVDWADVAAAGVLTRHFGWRLPEILAAIDDFGDVDRGCCAIASALRSAYEAGQDENVSGGSPMAADRLALLEAVAERARAVADYRTLSTVAEFDALRVALRALDSAPAPDAGESAVCTGLTARWCPVHGDCTCSRDGDGEDSCGCPLHDILSTHAEPTPAPEGRTCASFVGELCRGLNGPCSECDWRPMCLDADHPREPER